MLDACIIGAPKCGTSSLFRWLTAHPEITGPCEEEKELFYFMDSDHPLTKTPNVHSSGIEAYKSLFPRERNMLKVEGTSHYLFQETAREALSQMSPEPLIVVVLRDPTERVWSSFQYTRNNLARLEEGVSFKQYVDWSLQGESQRVKEYVSHQGSAYVLARDLIYGRYIEFLRSWRRAVSRDRLVVLRFNDVTERSRSVCEEITSELGVNDSFYVDFEFGSKNTTYEAASQSLHTLARRVGRAMPDGAVKKTMKWAYMSVATHDGSPQRMSEDRRALDKLRDYYRPYNKQLGKEFSLDVSRWL